MFIWTEWFVKSDVTPWQRTYDCQRSTFGVVAECVHGSSLLVVCWSRQGILAVSWVSVLLQSLCISYHGWTIARNNVWYHVCAKNCFPHFRLPLWHVLNETKIQNYYATPMVTKKNGLNYSKLNYYFRTGSVVNKVSRLYIDGKLVTGNW